MKTLLVATCVADFDALSGAPRDTIELILAPTKQAVAYLLATTPFDRAATLVSDLPTAKPVDITCVLDARCIPHNVLKWPAVRKAAAGDTVLVYRDPVQSNSITWDLDAAKQALGVWRKEQREKELRVARGSVRFAWPLEQFFETRNTCVNQVLASAPDGVVIVGCSPETRAVGAERLLQRLN